MAVQFGSIFLKLLSRLLGRAVSLNELRVVQIFYRLFDAFVLVQIDDAVFGRLLTPLGPWCVYWWFLSLPDSLAACFILLRQWVKELNVTSVLRCSCGIVPQTDHLLDFLQTDETAKSIILLDLLLSTTGWLMHTLKHSHCFFRIVLQQLISLTHPQFKLITNKHRSLRLKRLWNLQGCSRHQA